MIKNTTPSAIFQTPYYKQDAPFMQSVMQELGNRYGTAIYALATAMEAQVDGGKLTTRFWQNYTGYLPQWERTFDNKYADKFDIIMGVARQNGLELRTYFCRYFEACDQHGGNTPFDLHRFLPWNMTPEELESFKKPLPKV